MEENNLNEKFPVSGVIKTGLVYGFLGFVSLAVLYVIAMIFWNNPSLYGTYYVYFAQTCVLIVFCHFLAGFFGQIAIYKKYSGRFYGPGNNSGGNPEKIKYYGVLSGFFTGCFILLLPLTIILLTNFNSSGFTHSLWLIFQNYMPFVLAGIISGCVGSYYAGSLLKKGLLKRDDFELDIQKKFVCSVLIALLILFVPLFFSLAEAHLYEPEVIVYGEYDNNSANFIKTDRYGNIEWKSAPIFRSGGRATTVLEMENKSFALFGVEPSSRGSIYTISYLNKNGILSESVPFMRSDAGIAYVIEIPGRGFLLSDAGMNILSLSYDGNITGHYAIPEDLEKDSSYVEMVYAGGDSVFLRWGKYCCFIDLTGNFSDIHSYGYCGYSDRLYRMKINQASKSSQGGYIICVNDEKSRELKALWLDENLDLVSEKIIGSTHSSFISVFEREGDEVIITDDVLRFEDRPYDYEQYLRIYYAGPDFYCDIKPGSLYYKTEVFDDAGTGYSLFTISDAAFSDKKKVVLKRCGYDGACLEPVSVLEDKFSDIKIMQTSDGGYLLSYIVGEV